MRLALSSTIVLTLAMQINFVSRSVIRNCAERRVKRNACRRERKSGGVNVHAEIHSTALSKVVLLVEVSEFPIT